MPPRSLLLGLCCTICWAIAPPAARGDFGCWRTPTTISQDMAASDAILIVELVKAVPLQQGGDFRRLRPSTFRVVRCLKGNPEKGESRFLEVRCTHPGEFGDRYLLLGTGQINPVWSSPIRISDRAILYLELLPTLPETGAKRLHGLLDYLGDEDTFIATDIQTEFSFAPYDAIAKLGPYLNRDQLIPWLTDDTLRASSRRVYLNLLSVCGDQNDLPWLEEQLRSEELYTRAGLDSLITCYLTLAGEEGLPLIEELFLRQYDPQALTAHAMLTGSAWQPLFGPALLEASSPEYADAYMAIMALRFHAYEHNCIERSRIVESLRIMLDCPALADLVIPDLAKLEDWDSIDKLFSLYAEANERNENWIRVPVIVYLQQCPLPRAEAYLEQCETIDPEAVRRANTFFPLAATAELQD